MFLVLVPRKQVKCQYRRSQSAIVAGWYSNVILNN